jgi:hypothetical protein
VTDFEAAQQTELVRLVGRRATREGQTDTVVPFLRFLRESRPTARRHGVIEPSLCAIVQGRKRMYLARRPSNTRRPTT